MIRNRIYSYFIYREIILFINNNKLYYSENNIFYKLRENIIFWEAKMLISFESSLNSVLKERIFHIWRKINSLLSRELMTQMKYFTSSIHWHNNCEMKNGVSEFIKFAFYYDNICFVYFFCSALIYRRSSLSFYTCISIDFIRSKQNTNNIWQIHKRV